MSKNTNKKPNPESDDMQPEYDFLGKNGMRGKYHRLYQQGHTVRITNESGTVTVLRYELEDGAVMLEPDVRKYFPDSERVNRALRKVIEIFPTNENPL
jgi:hypothetical protein